MPLKWLQRGSQLHPSGKLQVCILGKDEASFEAGRTRLQDLEKQIPKRNATGAADVSVDPSAVAIRRTR